MKRKSIFATEAAMCTAFCDWAKKQGWTPYPETAGWDVLLVAADGTQIGVQAKLQFTVKLLAQCLHSSWYDACAGVGPDFRAVLLPGFKGDHEAILQTLGLMQFHCYGTTAAPMFSPAIGGGHDSWHYWNPAQREKLPAYVPDVQPGASGPVQLTEWKIAALRVSALLDIRGYVTRADFKRERIDPRRWMLGTETSKWLLPGAVSGQFVRGPGLRFAEQHPVVFAQIRSELEAEGAST
jgi:hypothetical protein